MSGTITIELSPPGVSARNPPSYWATIRLDGAEFVDVNGRRIRQSASIVLAAVSTGWFFGD